MPARTLLWLLLRRRCTGGRRGILTARPETTHWRERLHTTASRGTSAHARLLSTHLISKGWEARSKPPAPLKAGPQPRPPDRLPPWSCVCAALGDCRQALARCCCPLPPRAMPPLLPGAPARAQEAALMLFTWAPWPGHGAPPQRPGKVPPWISPTMLRAGLISAVKFGAFQKIKRSCGSRSLPGPPSCKPHDHATADAHC